MTTPDDPVPELLRGARRWADLSQRQLAGRAGVPQSSVARLEAGRRRARWDEVTVLLAACGLRLQVVDVDEAPVDLPALEPAVDRAGRRFPAHLDLREPGGFGGWWADGRYCWLVHPDRPRLTFDLARERRDRRRDGSLLPVQVRTPLPRPRVDPATWEEVDWDVDEIEDWEPGSGTAAAEAARRRVALVPREPAPGPRGRQDRPPTV